MNEDRILSLIQQHRIHQRARLSSLTTRGMLIILQITAVGCLMAALVGGSMSQIWGSFLLTALFLASSAMLFVSLLFAIATVLPLDGVDLFSSSSRWTNWNVWLTVKGFEGRSNARFSSLAPEAAAGEEEAEPSSEQIALKQERLSAFIAATVLDGQRIDLSVDPILRAEAFSLWSVWFITERCAGLLWRSVRLMLLGLVLSGITSIQVQEVVTSKGGGSAAKAGATPGGGGGPSGGPSGGPGASSSSSSGPPAPTGIKGGVPDVDPNSQSGKSGKGGKGGKSGQSGQSGQLGKAGKAGKTGKAGSPDVDLSAPEEGSEAEESGEE